MKITFVLPYAGLSGGIRVVAIYARLLRDRGHTVYILSNARKFSIRDTLKTLIRCRKLVFGLKKHGSSHLDTEDPFWITVNRAGPIKNKDVPDSDIVIATWWKTAEWVSRLSPAKGRKIYFCQGFETHHEKYKKRAEATYYLPMTQICVSRWVCESINNLTGRNDQKLVLNGISLESFFPAPGVKRDLHCFGFLFSEARIKGVDIIIEALNKAKAINPNISSVAFGSSFPSESTNIPPWIEFYKDPPAEVICQIYSRCNAWLFGSREEGFGLPILEAMACKTPVIATPAGAARDLISDDYGSLIPYEDPDAMAQQIIKFSRMSLECWEQKSNAAYRAAQKHNWESSVSRFESILLKVKEDTVYEGS